MQNKVASCDISPIWRKFLRVKKEGRRIDQGPLSVKVKNLQRGTADAVELGGKATVCIN
ncbi:hypothetical protein SAMN05428983_0349 [Agrobacterium fabrum]|uniref:Uncharacterized protein n=1 Tax=Agrobacterium fabrum TaxID=1176649 RepID=A0A7Z7BHV4_9HYPH|nr:hypothetical protein [Agrobacterium fabrum]SDJ14357.1 hypothetical protein SAMN05428983_0349 [Agrobacterium fabrum]